MKTGIEKRIVKTKSKIEKLENKKKKKSKKFKSKIDRMYAKLNDLKNTRDIQKMLSEKGYL